MRLLFDANVPKGLRRMLPGHETSTAQEQGWAAIKNGDLLREAEAAGFDVMITADKNLSYQQNLSERTIALVVLWTNDWSLLQSLKLTPQSMPHHQIASRRLGLSNMGPRPARVPDRL